VRYMSPFLTSRLRGDFLALMGAFNWSVSKARPLTCSDPLVQVGEELSRKGWRLRFWLHEGPGCEFDTEP
jgi:hypothetical protein